MRLWFVHSGEVPLHTQIVTQITLGILSGELAPGERLPSTRSLGRRFKLHPNTVSAAYRQLHQEGWVHTRRGSGVFVRPAPTQPTQDPIDHLLTQLILHARAAKVTPEQLKQRFEALLEAPEAPRRFLLLEPEESLREIVLAELTSFINLPIQTAALPPADLIQTVILTLPSRFPATRDALPPGTPIHCLQIRSIPASLAPWLPAPPSALVAIASSWPRFLTLAHTMLVAAGVHPDSILCRDANLPGWQDGLLATAAVICDTVTSARLPPGTRPIPFPLLDPASNAAALERLTAQPAL